MKKGAKVNGVNCRDLSLAPSHIAISDERRKMKDFFNTCKRLGNAERVDVLRVVSQAMCEEGLTVNSIADVELKRSLKGARRREGRSKSEE